MKNQAGLDMIRREAREKRDRPGGSFAPSTLAPATAPATRADVMDAALFLIGALEICTEAIIEAIGNRGR